MNEKYRYLGKNTIIFAISSFGTKVLSFLLVPLYTATLTTAEYGAADLITTTATLLVYVLTLNIASSVLRFTIDQRDNGCNILSYGIRVLVIGTLVCGVGVEIVSLSGLIDWPSYYYVFVVLYFFASALYEIMTNYLRAIDKVPQVATAGVISALIMICGNILFLLVVRIGLVGYLVSLVMGPMVAAIYCIGTARVSLNVYFKMDCDRVLRKEMVRYCTPLIFNNIALWINAFLDRYFVTYFCGMEENGIYSVAGKIPTILSTCYSVFASAWTLSAIKEFDANDTDGFFSKTYSTYSALMTTACSAIIICNIPLASFLYVNEFFEAWKYSSVLLLSVMFNTLTVFQGSLFTAAKKPKAVATTTIISAITNTVLNILFIPTMGALGAAIATAVAYFVMWLTRYLILKKIVSLRVDYIKDGIVYALITFQIVFEHLENHFYLGQIVCLALIILLNWKYEKNILAVVLRSVRGNGRS